MYLYFVKMPLVFDYFGNRNPWTLC